MKQKTQKQLLLRTVAVAVLAASTASAQDGWDWGTELYFWGASLGGSTTSGGNIDIGIDTLIEDLKIGGMAAVAGYNGPWRIFADLIYLDVADKGNVKGSVGGVPVTLNGRIELKGAITTFGAGYKFYEQSGTALEVMGGARVLWLDGAVEATVPPFPKVRESAKGSNWDAIVGLHGRTDLSDQWYLTYFADIGAGDSDLTWGAGFAFNYEMPKFDLSIGYRYLDWDFRNYGPFNSLNMSGAFIGVKIPL